MALYNAVTAVHSSVSLQCIFVLSFCVSLQPFTSLFKLCCTLTIVKSTGISNIKCPIQSKTKNEFMDQENAILSLVPGPWRPFAIGTFCSSSSRGAFLGCSQIHRLHTWALWEAGDMQWKATQYVNYICLSLGKKSKCIWLKRKISSCVFSMVYFMP